MAISERACATGALKERARASVVLPLADSAGEIAGTLHGSLVKVADFVSGNSQPASSPVATSVTPLSRE